jgi:hypothetical protein
LTAPKAPVKKTGAFDEHEKSLHIKDNCKPNAGGRAREILY